MSEDSRYWQGEAPLRTPEQRAPGGGGRWKWLLAGGIALVIAVAVAIGIRSQGSDEATGAAASGSAESSSSGRSEASAAQSPSGSAGSGSATTNSNGSAKQTDPNLPGGTQSAGPAVTPPPDFTPTDGPSAALTAASGKGETIDVYDLKVGDCLLDPGGNPTITKVTRVACSTAHGYEVFDAFELTGTGSYPGADKVQTDADTRCGQRFTTFVGRPVKQSKLSYTFFLPTEGTWPKGDRAVTCMLYDPEAMSTGTLRGANR